MFKTFVSLVSVHASYIGENVASNIRALMAAGKMAKYANIYKYFTSLHNYICYYCNFILLLATCFGCLNSHLQANLQWSSTLLCCTKYGIPHCLHIMYIKLIISKNIYIYCLRWNYELVQTTITLLKYNSMGLKC